MIHSSLQICTLSLNIHLPPVYLRNIKEAIEYRLNKFLLK